MPVSAFEHGDPRRRLLDVLRCPVCGEGLSAAGGALRCARRHTFDIARHGYVSLLTGDMRAGTADTAAMVQARDAFLGAGHYAPLARAVAELTARWCPPQGVVLDAGAGTGHYLAAALDAVPGAVGLGLDASKFALRRAARAHPRAGAAVWDVWRELPVRSGVADVVLNVFAPRNGPEFQRVLRPGGALLVVTPTARHLAELRQAAGLLSVDAAKEERLGRTLDAHFRQERAEALEVDHLLRLTPQEANDLVAMGPSARHVDADELARRIASMGTPIEIAASFNVAVYRPK
ncbi:23S rRNA m(1)G-748 methyltransferase [Actinacidiphila yanglinensis]|uniref:23S rRNA m(1)G-748 methyltransferase n=1 Tax=Actinacidiphila yanglinensis TaxID=310779 RepID=A0A1H5ZEI6_9ACTN|nr:methyltransferase domain-containing protein [Actinacidiphila yanglinensis]SEG34702.1 23S rRNA m(1)G-748 methyltransferase [Actinacidiphila yanglinensis]